MNYSNDDYDSIGFDPHEGFYICPSQAPEEWYNDDIEPDHGEEARMAHLKNLEEVEGLEPIATRKTHPWGIVDLYAPQADPSEWGEHPWVIVTEKSDEGPIYAEVPADKAWPMFERPWSIPKKFRK